MYRLKQVPLLKLFIAYASGILLARTFLDLIDFNLLLALIFFSILVLGLSYLSKRINQKFSPLISIFILVQLGTISFISNDERTSPNHFSKYLINPEHSKTNIIAKTISVGKTQEDNIKLVLKIQSIINKNDTTASTGKLLVYTNIKYHEQLVNEGDILCLNTYITPIKSAQNPFAFDPKQYYHYQNIHYQAYIKSNNYSLISREPNINIFFKKINHSIQGIIRQSIIKTENANLIISIMLGDKQSLNRGLLKTFSNTGARHILTVSGMHVGIVALLISFLFSFIQIKNNYVNTLKIVAILLTVWLYVFLTGAGAATLRAAFMISLLMIGINIKKTINTYNLLFGSALIMLVINPFILFQLSFILSYTAILSILIFYNPIYNIIKIKKYKILNYLWQLISLSIAAQILIFPLSILYFHNAPSLFIITAIIATPMAFTSIALGFSIIASSFISPILSSILSKTLSNIIDISMTVIKYIDSISFNIGEKIFLEAFDILLIYTAILTIYLVIKQRKYYYIIYTVVLIFLLITNQSLKSNQSQKIVIYSIKKQNLIDIFIKDTCYTTENIKTSVNTIQYSAKNLRMAKRAKIIRLDNKTNTNAITTNHNIIEVKGQTIVVLNNTNDFLPLNRKQIDILVLNNKVKFNLDILLKKYIIKNIVLLKSMKYNVRKSWISQATKAGINYWDIKSKGAYINLIKTI